MPLGKARTSSAMATLRVIHYFESQSNDWQAYVFVMGAECLVSVCLPRKCLKVCKLTCVVRITCMFTTWLEMSCRHVSTCSFYHYLFLISLSLKSLCLGKSMIDFPGPSLFCLLELSPRAMADSVSWKNIISQNHRTFVPALIIAAYLHPQNQLSWSHAEAQERGRLG